MSVFVPETRRMDARLSFDLPQGWKEERLHNVATLQTSNVDKKSVEGERPVKLCNYVDVYYNDAITSDIFHYVRVEATKLDALMGSSQSAITRLTEYRTALITAATTGKIDVRKWKTKEIAA